MKQLLFLFLLLVSAFAMELPEDSLYNLSSSWEDNNGKSFKFSKLKSKKYKVVTMIFTSCPAACPMMISDLKKLDSTLNDKQKEKVEYEVFSIDPSDSAQKLKLFHEKFALDKRFRFLKSNQEDAIQDLAAVLGFKYKKVSQSMYSHGTDVYLLNPAGQIISSVGRSFKARELAAKIPK